MITAWFSRVFALCLTWVYNRVLTIREYANIVVLAEGRGASEEAKGSWLLREAVHGAPSRDGRREGPCCQLKPASYPLRLSSRAESGAFQAFESRVRFSLAAPEPVSDAGWLVMTTADQIR